MLVQVFLVGFFMVASGVIYDVVNRTPTYGIKVDSQGKKLTETFLEGKVHGQYIMEGLVASSFFVIGCLGFIMFDMANTRAATQNISRRKFLIAVGLGLVWVSLLGTRTFFSSKIPTYDMQRLL
eukprot:m.57557 g.57557  ORF g.57557 m.57557 type:complete len:124 (-) comp11116_c0_seq1:1610-1981(-)